MTKIAAAFLFILAFTAVVSSAAAELRIDANASLADDRILQTNDSTTLGVHIKSYEAYSGLRVNVSIPTARHLQVSPGAAPVDIVGEGETRDYDFTITSRGQDKGSYNISVTVYDEAGNANAEKKITISVVGEKGGVISGSILVILMIIVVAVIVLYAVFEVKKKK